MSYVVTILRTRNGVRLPISLDEFLVTAAALPDWTTDREQRLGVKRMPDGSDLTVWWEDGVAWTANPGELGLTALLPLAAALKARLRGDDFETYRSLEETYRHPDDAAEAATAQRSVAPAKVGPSLLRIIKVTALCVLAAMAVLAWWGGPVP